MPYCREIESYPSVVDREVVGCGCYSSGLRRRSGCWFVDSFDRFCNEISVVGLGG